MSLNESIEAFDALLGAFDPIMLDELQEIAGDGLAMVDRRVTRQGLNAQGRPFPDYSPGYKLEKQRAGKYRGIVDLTYTGNMWRGIQIIMTEQTGSVVKVTVAGTTPDGKAKMSNNADLRGDFLALMDSEVDILIEDSDERLTGKINGYFE